MNEEKEVILERAAQGSFGFSILGGAGMKYPACVCEVDDGGPANLSNMVHVGDRLLRVNGEEVGVLPPKDLVLRIRQAPSPCSFVLLEDLELRKQVLHVLRKKERKNEGRVRKERLSSTGSEGSVTSATDTTAGKVRRKSSPSYVNSSTGAAVEETGRKKKHLDKIIEVEPSVNITNNQSGIVKVHRNKILGRLDTPGDTPTSPSSQQSPGSRREWSPGTRQSPSSGEGSSRESPHRESPLRSGRSTDRAGSNSPYRNQKQFALPDHSGSTPNIPYSASSTATSAHPGVRSLDCTPEHRWADPVIGEGGMNGDVRILSDSSSGVSPSETPARNSVVSMDDKSSKSEVGSVTEVVIVESVEGEELEVKGMLLQDVTTPECEDEEDHNYDSGVALQIPAWDGHPLSRFGKPPRNSLSEEILMGEMAKSGVGVVSGRQDNGEVNNAVSTDALRGQELANSSPQRDRTHQVAKLVRRSSSKKKSGDPYTSSVTMARRLYMLDGFKKSEVAAKLSDPSDYGKSIAVEYLKFFEFQDMSVVESLRQFLLHFSLTGESQERERVMVHFSNRYHECNPTEFESVDTVHGVTIALLLLNTDLHTNHGGKKMTSVQFSHNVDLVAKGVSKSLIRSLYDEIRKKPLKWAVDDDEDGATPTPNKPGLPDMELSSECSDSEDVYHVTIPGTFVEVELSANTPLFKEGYILKKNIMEAPHKKVARGKRQWRPYYAYLKGFLLYLQPPRQGDLHLEDTSSALCICHSVAMGAYDYHKKNSVLRVTTAEWQSFLLQANDTTDMQQWIVAINKAAATYSSPPLAAAVSSSSVFQRPTFPLTPTRNTVEQQAQAHEARVKTLNKEQEEHQAYKPTGSKAKHDDLKNWFDKYEFQGFEIHRFQVYYASLFNSTVDIQAKLPSGLVPSPSISTLATSGTGDGNSELSAWKSVTPPSSPNRSSERKHSKPHSSSPLTSSKKSHKKK